VPNTPKKSEVAETQNDLTAGGIPNAFFTGLLGAETCLRVLFPDETTRPCVRYFRELQRKRLVPFKKIGRRVFFDPVEVRRALDRQFTVHAR
jgi:hypothetical protein